MGPSEKSFNQVKAILGKLDRNIDQLRDRRTNKPLPIPAPLPPAETSRNAQPAARSVEPVQTATSSRPSQYGRATPIPPSSNN